MPGEWEHDNSSDIELLHDYVLRVGDDPTRGRLQKWRGDCEIIMDISEIVLLCHYGMARHGLAFLCSDGLARSSPHRLPNPPAILISI